MNDVDADGLLLELECEDLICSTRSSEGVRGISVSAR